MVAIRWRRGVLRSRVVRLSTAKVVVIMTKRIGRRAKCHSLRKIIEQNNEIDRSMRDLV